VEFNRYGTFLLYTGPVTDMCAGTKDIALITQDTITSLSKRVNTYYFMFYTRTLGN